MIQLGENAFSLSPPALPSFALPARCIQRRQSCISIHSVSSSVQTRSFNQNRCTFCQRTVRMYVQTPIAETIDLDPPCVISVRPSVLTSYSFLRPKSHVTAAVGWYVCLRGRRTYRPLLISLYPSISPSLSSFLPFSLASSNSRVPIHQL